MDKKPQEPVLPPVATGPAAEPTLAGEPTAPRYTNRCGRTYLVSEGKSRSGKLRYYANPNPSGKPVASMPEGYEFYEHPKDGQVVVRKIKLTQITPSERDLVADGITRLRQRNDVIVDVEACALAVYTPLRNELDIGESRRLLPDAAPPTADQPLNVVFTKPLTYGRTLRVELVDSEKRWFVVQRWCFVGKFHDWLRIDGPAPLEELIEKFGKNLGKDQPYDLTE
jgi:hypothetical protein